MAPRLTRLRRRRDGMVEIRRIRARDVLFTSDAVVLLGMLAGWLLLAVVLVMSLVFDPPLLLVAVWLVVALHVDHRHAAAPRLAPAPVSPPIGPAA